MCILCVIQKWSRRVATMLPWLVIPLIGLWLLSQLLPPAFRFEITSPRLACVLVLLLTLFWYEILMPQLSTWRMRRNAQLRERKRFEAIEMQKLKKTATRRCRNCQNPYRDQNPGGGKFMCSYCGHISKRPVLDFPVPPGLGLSNSGILKDLVGKGGKILNGKVWSDNGWMCGQDWLDNGNWVGGPLPGKASYWRSGAGLFGGTDHCLAEKSYSRILNFAVRAFAAFFLSIIWLCRKVFRVSSSRDDASSDAERRAMLDQGDENGVNCHESKGEKARRKAEEKRQARLEKELLEEEERKQREEVARLVEERRRLRDEKMEAEKERRKGSPPHKERESKKEAEKKRQERKKERDRGSSKSNSDAEELEKRGNKESERYRRNEGDRRDHHKPGPENVKAHGAEVGHTFKGAPASNARGNAGTRYFDRVRGTFLSSSRAFTGGGFFGKSSVPTVSREHKSNAFVDHMQATTNRREVSQPDRFAGKSNVKGDEKNINRPALIEPQTGGPGPAPKKSWQQLFTRSASSPCSSNVISRPNGNSKPEVQNSPFASNPPSTQAFDNPINFGLPSPFTLSPVTFVSTNSSTSYPLSNESMFPRIGEASHQYLPEESEIFEDPCYVPDPVSLLGPVSESLDNFQLDLGLVADSGLETPCAVKNVPTTAELHRPSPIESPMSRLRVPEERHASSFSFPSTPKAQDLHQLPIDGSPTLNEAGTWQMWTSSPLGQDGLGLVGGSASWLLPPDLNRPKNEDILHHVPQKTMASLFKKDDQVLSGPHSPQKVFVGSVQNGGSLNSVSGGSDGSWLPNTLFGPTSSSEDQFSLKPKDEAPQSNITYGSSRGTVSNHQADVSAANCWVKKDWNVQGSGLGVGNPSMAKPHIGGLYSSSDVQSLWSYD